MKAFMQRIRDQVKEFYKPVEADAFELEFNKVKSQFKDTECGIFSIVFLTQCLKNIKFKSICEKMQNDDMMVKFRDVFFRPNVV